VTTPATAAAGQLRDRRRRRPGAGIDGAAWGGAFLAVGLVLGLWFALSGFGLVSEKSLVGPVDVFTQFSSEWNETLDFLGKTMVRVAVGLVIGCSAGFALALLTASVKVLDKLFEPAIAVMRSVPPFVLAPFVILWFGYRPIGPILFVAWSCFFILYIDATEAIKNVRTELRWAAQSLGAGRARILRSVVLPSTLPDVVGGLRVAVVVSVNMALLVEFLSSSGGIGYLLIRGYTFFRLDVLFMAIIVAILATLAIDRLISFAGKRLLRWAE
jgi:ABC-type nitrate/sulfonate/bicarbonate transport system permease component